MKKEAFKKRLFSARVSASLRNRRAFIIRLRKGSALLDVGCGNNSAIYVKKIRPDIRYYGIDITDYHNDKNIREYMEEYYLVSPEKFPEEICDINLKFDAVVSNHNLEHCNKPYDVVEAMCQKLKNGGRIFIAYPCADSVNYPSRKEGLNFYDNPEHKTILDMNDIIKKIEECGVNIIFCKEKYHPLIWTLIGAVLEPLSKRGIVSLYKATWAYWGFETVIWGQKINTASR